MEGSGIRRLTMLQSLKLHLAFRQARYAHRCDISSSFPSRFALRKQLTKVCWIAHGSHRMSRRMASCFLHSIARSRGVSSDNLALFGHRTGKALFTISQGPRQSLPQWPSANILRLGCTSRSSQSLKLAIIFNQEGLYLLNRNSAPSNRFAWSQQIPHTEDGIACSASMLVAPTSPILSPSRRLIR